MIPTRNMPHYRTQEEVAQILGLTRQRVEQLERRAIQKVQLGFLDWIQEENPIFAEWIIRNEEMRLSAQRKTLCEKKRRQRAKMHIRDCHQRIATD